MAIIKIDLIEGFGIGIRRKHCDCSESCREIYRYLGEQTVDRGKVVLAIGDRGGEEFATFWNKQLQEGSIPEGLGTATFSRPKPPAGTFSVAVPSEVWIAIVAGTTHVVAEAAAKFLWKTVKEFIKDEVEFPSGRLITLNLNGQEMIVRKRDLPDELPEQFYKNQ